MQIYDPGYLSFMYALKAMVAISISAFTHYMLFGQQVLIWATMTPIQVFLLNATLSQQADRKTHLLGFAVCSTIAVGFFTILAEKALNGEHSLQDILWLALPVLLLSFGVGMSRAHSIDLYRMFIPVVVNSLVAAVYVDSHVILPIYQSMFVVFSGAMIGIVIGFLLLNNPGNYGKYTQVYYPAVLNHLQNMVKNLNSQSEFNRYKDLTFSLIHNIKQTLHTKSSLYNDNYMIKNIKRAIFYIYRIEDIYLIINLLPNYKIAKKYPLLIHEIIENLNSLSKIFSGKIPKIERQQVDKVLSIENANEVEKALQNILRILYYKMESFCRVGKNPDPAFNPPAKKSFKNIPKAFDYNNITFRFSVKYSIAIGMSLIFATLLHINRGIWISMGVVSVVRPSIGGMQKVSFEYFFSAVVGIGVGVGISVFSNAYVFYLLFGFLVFLVVYLRVFPFWLWSGFMMCLFVMMYSIMYEDFLLYVLDRLVDIGIGVVFAVIVFRVVFPRFAHNLLKPLLIKQVGLLKDICTLVMESNKEIKPLDSNMIQTKYAEFLHNVEELKNHLRDSKSERAEASNQIVVYGFDLINVLESLIIKVNEIAQIYSTSDYDKDMKEIYANDIHVLQERFLMIENLLANKETDFSFDENNVFLGKQHTHFAWTTHEIFQSQNKLYNLLNEKHISAPE